MNWKGFLRFGLATLVLTVVGLGLANQVGAMQTVKAAGPISVAIKGWVEYRLLVWKPGVSTPSVERYRAANVQVNIQEVNGTASWEAYTDGQGNYSVTVPDAKTYLVTPVQAVVLQFTPTNKTVTMSGFDRVVNFVGKLN